MPNKIVVANFLNIGDDQVIRSPIVTNVRRKPNRQGTEPLASYFNREATQQKAMMTLILPVNQLSEQEQESVIYAETLKLGNRGLSTKQQSLMAR